MTLEELLKAKGLTDDQIKAILDGMKENKIFTASEENLDIRYGKLKTDYDNLTTQNGEATKLIEQLKKGTKNSDELQGKACRRNQKHQNCVVEGRMNNGS